jgi:eukaryotic-like serine/threonine-protein kinase
MGMMYEALDTELERKVAIKLIHPSLTADADASARFKQEARAVASLAHSNVVTVYDVGVAEDRHAFLVMELLHGSTLRCELHQHRRFPAARASGILRDVCAAVDAGHAKGHLLRSRSSTMAPPGQKRDISEYSDWLLVLYCSEHWCLSPSSSISED